MTSSGAQIGRRASHEVKVARGGKAGDEARDHHGIGRRAAGRVEPHRDGDAVGQRRVVVIGAHEAVAEGVVGCDEAGLLPEGA